MTPLSLLLVVSFTLLFQPLHMVESFDVHMLKEQAHLNQARQERIWSMLNQKNPFHSEYNPNTNLLIPIEDPDNITVIINRLHVLDESFTPTNLVNLQTLDSTHPSRLLAQPAATAFLALRARVLQELGIVIEVRSGYRSFEDQQRVFNTYAQRDGVLQANTYSAISGQSEHQSGLGLDLAEQGNSYLRFSQSPAYDFLKQHAYQYGFILRYPQNKSHITGYIYEPWHWRYVGVELATLIFDQNITLDDVWVERMINP